MSITFVLTRAITGDGIGSGYYTFVACGSVIGPLEIHFSTAFQSEQRKLSSHGSGCDHRGGKTDSFFWPSGRWLARTVAVSLCSWNLSSDPTLG
jgi:hypothetical protein